MVKQSIEQDRCLRFKYEDRKGQVFQRTVSARRIKQDEYLVAYDHTPGKKSRPKDFRLDRMSSIEILPPWWNPKLIKLEGAPVLDALSDILPKEELLPLTETVVVRHKTAKGGYKQTLVLWAGLDGATLTGVNPDSLRDISIPLRRITDIDVVVNSVVGAMKPYRFTRLGKHEVALNKGVGCAFMGVIILSGWVFCVLT